MSVSLTLAAIAILFGLNHESADIKSLMMFETRSSKSLCSVLFSRLYSSGRTATPLPTSESLQHDMEGATYGPIFRNVRDIITFKL